MSVVYDAKTQRKGKRVGWMAVGGETMLISLNLVREHSEYKETSVEGAAVEDGKPQETAQGGLGSVEPIDIMVWGSASAGIHIIEVETLSFVGPRWAECRMQNHWVQTGRLGDWGNSRWGASRSVPVPPPPTRWGLGERRRDLKLETRAPRHGCSGRLLLAAGRWASVQHWADW